VSVPAPREIICTFCRLCDWDCVGVVDLDGLVGWVVAESDDNVVGREVWRWVLIKSRTSLSIEVVRTYVPVRRMF